MKKVWSAFMVMVLLAVMVFGGTVLAFSDLQDGPAEEKVNWLKEEKIINGKSEDTFAPNDPLTVSQAIHMIVKGMKLNLDHVRFIKEPKASDYFSKVEDDAWYAPSFIIASHHGLNLPKDIDPMRNITKEEYTWYLGNALLSQGDYIFIELYIMMQDEHLVDPDYMNVIQKMLIAKVANLDDEQYFHPNKTITRLDAAKMLYAAVHFVKDNATQTSGQPGDVDNNDVTFSTHKVNEDINQVTVSWGEKPHPGYRLSIKQITFDNNDKKAVVYYELHYPDPAALYPQVITEPKAAAYVPSGYEVAVERYIASSSEENTEAAMPIAN